MIKQKISIVGAGLVGSLWAVLLAKRGYEVTIFEKRSDIRKLKASEDRSINLILTSRGLNGLSRADLLEEAISLAVPIFGRIIHARDGSTQYQAYGNSDECNFSISRSELNKFLINAAENVGAKFFFDRQLDDIDFDRKLLFFNNGAASEAYDILFGTDGAGSLVRRNLCKQFPDIFQEHTEWLDANYKELFLPAGKDSQYNIEKNALHIWPRGGHMMMALANLDGSFTITLYMPQTNEQKKNNNFSEITTVEKVKKLFEEDFNDAIPLMPNFANEFISNPEGKLGTVRCSQWTYANSVVLMGDAAHAMVPFFGQGMNCGFEDCLNFLNILDESSADWAQTISKFENRQKPNATAIADMALENWTEMRDKVGDAHFLLRKKVEAYLEKEFPDIYKSRYGMVTYTMIPYALAQQIGLIQNEILDIICSTIKSIDDISYAVAKKLVMELLFPVISSHQLSLKTDLLVSNTRKILTQ